MAEQRALALFDFDGTLIRGDSILAYLRHARRLKALSRGEYLKLGLHAIPWLLKKKSDEALKGEAVAFSMRLSPERRYALNRSFAEECLLPRVFPAGRACLEQHRQAGRLVVIVSASPENYMEFVAPGLGADVLLCTQLLSETATGPNCKGQEKVRRIEAYLAQAGIGPDWSDSYAYGDSTSDLPMLRLCAHPVAVNPKRKLRRAAPEMATVKWKEK